MRLYGYGTWSIRTQKAPLKPNNEKNYSFVFQSRLVHEKNFFNSIILSNSMIQFGYTHFIIFS